MATCKARPKCANIKMRRYFWRGWGQGVLTPKLGAVGCDQCLGRVLFGVELHIGHTFSLSSFVLDNTNILHIGKL